MAAAMHAAIWRMAVPLSLFSFVSAAGQSSTAYGCDNVGQTVPDLASKMICQEVFGGEAYALGDLYDMRSRHSLGATLFDRTVLEDSTFVLRSPHQPSGPELQLNKHNVVSNKVRDDDVFGISAAAKLDLKTSKLSVSLGGSVKYMTRSFTDKRYSATTISFKTSMGSEQIIAKDDVVANKLADRLAQVVIPAATHFVRQIDYGSHCYATWSSSESADGKSTNLDQLADLAIQQFSIGDKVNYSHSDKEQAIRSSFVSDCDGHAGMLPSSPVDAGRFLQMALNNSLNGTEHPDCDETKANETKLKPRTCFGRSVPKRIYLQPLASLNLKGNVSQMNHDIDLMALTEVTTMLDTLDQQHADIGEQDKPGGILGLGGSDYTGNQAWVRTVTQYRNEMDTFRRNMLLAAGLFVNKCRGTGQCPFSELKNLTDTWKNSSFSEIYFKGDGLNIGWLAKQEKQLADFRDKFVVAEKNGASWANSYGDFLVSVFRTSCGENTSTLGTACNKHLFVYVNTNVPSSGPTNVNPVAFGQFAASPRSKNDPTAHMEFLLVDQESLCPSAADLCIFRKFSGMVMYFLNGVVQNQDNPPRSFQVPLMPSGPSMPTVEGDPKLRYFKVGWNPLDPCRLDPWNPLVANGTKHCNGLSSDWALDEAGVYNYEVNIGFSNSSDEIDNGANFSIGLNQSTTGAANGLWTSFGQYEFKYCSKYQIRVRAITGDFAGKYSEETDEVALPIKINVTAKSDSLNHRLLIESSGWVETDMVLHGERAACDLVNTSKQDSWATSIYIGTSFEDAKKNSPCKITSNSNPYDPPFKATASCPIPTVGDDTPNAYITTANGVYMGIGQVLYQGGEQITLNPTLGRSRSCLSVAAQNSGGPSTLWLQSCHQFDGFQSFIVNEPTGKIQWAGNSDCIISQKANGVWRWMLGPCTNDAKLTFKRGSLTQIKSSAGCLQSSPGHEFAQVYPCESDALQLWHIP